jgi:hypothetical protein
MVPKRAALAQRNVHRGWSGKVSVSRQARKSRKLSSPYPTTWPAFRKNVCQTRNLCRSIFPNRAVKTEYNSRPVSAEEKRSVDSTAITPSHRSVTIHATHILCGLRCGGLTATSLFKGVVGRFARNDHVMDMAFTQPRRSDPDEACFLLQFLNR